MNSGAPNSRSRACRFVRVIALASKAKTRQSGCMAAANGDAASEQVRFVEVDQAARAMKEAKWEAVARQLIGEGAPVDGITRSLLDAGAGLISTTKALRSTLGISLGEAKVIVDRNLHPRCTPQMSGFETHSRMRSGPSSPAAQAEPSTPRTAALGGVGERMSPSTAGRRQ